MKVIKKYTTIILDTNRVNSEITINLSYGHISGPYYGQTSPTQEFDSEEEALTYAYKFDSYATWLILPIIRFDNFNNE